MEQIPQKTKRFRDCENGISTFFVDLASIPQKMKRRTKGFPSFFVECDNFERFKSIPQKMTDETFQNYSIPQKMKGPPI